MDNGVKPDAKMEAMLQGAQQQAMVNAMRLDHTRRIGDAIVAIGVAFPFPLAPKDVGVFIDACLNCVSGTGVRAGLKLEEVVYQLKKRWLAASEDLKKANQRAQRRGPVLVSADGQPVASPEPPETGASAEENETPAETEPPSSPEPAPAAPAPPSGEPAPEPASEPPSTPKAS